MVDDFDATEEITKVDPEVQRFGTAKHSFAPKFSALTLLEALPAHLTRMASRGGATPFELLELASWLQQLTERP